jgi:hypothetical protein
LGRDDLVKQLILCLALSLCSWATTPPTLIANNGFGIASTNPRSFTSITWQTGDIILVAQMDEGGTGDVFSTAPTVSGLTFTNLLTHTASSNCALAVWKATAASGGSGAVSATHATGGGANWSSWLWQWRGSDGLGNTATQFTTTKTVALTPAGGADSGIIWIVGDFAGNVTPTATPTSPNETTRQALNSSFYDTITADITDQTSAGAVSYGIVTTAAGPFSIAVVEVKGTAGGAATCTPTLTLMGVGRCGS